MGERKVSPWAVFLGAILILGVAFHMARAQHPTGSIE